jgi:hypothetical protein
MLQNSERVSEWWLLFKAYWAIVQLSLREDVTFLWEDDTVHLILDQFRGGGEPGAPPPPPPPLEKIWFFGVKSWFFTRNTPKIFAPPSARRNFFKCAPPNLKSWIRPCNSFSLILIVLAHWDESARVDMSLTSCTLSWFRANQSLFLLLNAACLT